MEEEPSDFARLDEDPFHMNMKTLWLFARRLRESGGETQKHMTNFHIRASFPLADLVMVLLGAALSLRVVRGGNIALGFGLSVSIGFAYFALIRVGQALGYNGDLPPLLAAWLGNLVFGALGLFLFWKVTR
jgi:lipopolysaccharide export system permease protein